MEIYDLAKFLPYQFEQSPQLQALVGLLNPGAQAIESEGYRLKYLRTLDLAEGAQLDEIGQLLGEGRAARTDVAYRAYLGALVRFNACDSTPDALIAYVKELTSATAVQYSEQYPCGFAIEHNGEVYLDLHIRLRALAPVGTRNVTTVQSGITANG